MHNDHRRIGGNRADEGRAKIECSVHIDHVEALTTRVQCHVDDMLMHRVPKQIRVRQIKSTELAHRAQHTQSISIPVRWCDDSYWHALLRVNPPELHVVGLPQSEHAITIATAVQFVQQR